MIDRNGRIVTNQHVVLDGKYVDVTVIPRVNGQIKHEKIESVGTLAISPLMSMALLQLPKKDLNRLSLEPLPLAEEGSLAEGDSVFAIGKANPNKGRQCLTPD